MPGSADPSGCRIALVLGSSDGGMGAHVRMLATGLADGGAQVTVLGPQSVARGVDMARGTRLSFRRVEIGDRPRLRDAGALVRLRRLLRAGPGSAGPEVVHAHGLRAGALCALALCRPALFMPAPFMPALFRPASRGPAVRGPAPRGPASRMTAAWVRGPRGPASRMTAAWVRGPRAGTRGAAARRGSGPGNGPALVVTVHNAPPLAGGVPALGYRALEMVVARGADVVLCVSGDLQARMRAAGARRVGHAVVPAPPARAAGDQPAAGSRTPGWAAGERPIVLGAGRLAPQKGFGILLEAAASWLDMDPKPLVVIAGAGPLAGTLRDQAAALGVDALFLGHRDDVPGLLAGADVIAIPSLWEGQPLVLQEALRAGVPIVATRVGGIPGLTGTAPPAPAPAPAPARAGVGGQGDGEAAVLVRPGDWRELAGAVRAVLTDQALAARLRAAALRRAAELPSQADAITAVLAAYADAGKGAS